MKHLFVQPFFLLCVLLFLKVDLGYCLDSDSPAAICWPGNLATTCPFCISEKYRSEQACEACDRSQCQQPICNPPNCTSCLECCGTQYAPDHVCRRCVHSRCPQESLICNPEFGECSCPSCCSSEYRLQKYCQACVRSKCPQYSFRCGVDCNVCDDCCFSFEVTPETCFKCAKEQCKTCSYQESCERCPYCCDLPTHDEERCQNCMKVQCPEGLRDSQVPQKKKPSSSIQNWMSFGIFILFVVALVSAVIVWKTDPHAKISCFQAPPGLDVSYRKNSGGEEGRGILGFEENLKNEEESEEGYNEEQKDV